MTRSTSGSPKARTLGAELRRAREAAHVGVRELARRLQRAHAWVNRTESGVRAITPEDVTGIAVALGLSTSERERLVELAREDDGPNWLRAGIPGVHQELVTLIEYERTASKIVEAAPLLVPGLLQTSEYARAVMSGTPGPDMETRIAMRASRRDILVKRNPPAFEAILMERALADPIDDPEVMVDQLRHLQKVAELPNVTLRVIPSMLRQWTPVHSGQFMIFEFPKAAPIVHLEHLGSAAFLTAANVVDTYQAALGTLRHAAMNPEESVEFIAACETKTEENIQ
ncbi:helix-turn-helix domain-containing protein [Saccharopolyspora hattusasensis]|uniref:helix-turn-helix domain-containing protein n=1 Tax=Saccharopolyspora hattusasensis TaxID=1128679 RepID=UPI003D968DDB